MKSKANYHYSLPKEVSAPIIKLQKVPMTTKWEDFADSVIKVLAILVFIVVSPLKWTIDVFFDGLRHAYCHVFAIFEQMLKLAKANKGPFSEINNTINYIYNQENNEEVEQVKIATDKKYTVVLELKDVLVKINSQNSRSGSKKDLHGMKLKDLQILKRKYLIEFLKKTSELGKLVLWSSLSKEVTDFILESVGIQSYFSQVLYEDACLREGKGLIKNASSVISEDLSQIIMVDHNFAVHARNPDNILYIPEFQRDDDCLLRILAGIQALHERQIADVRRYLHYILR